MESSSKDSTRTRSQKQRQAKEIDERKRQRRHQRQFLLPRKDKVIRPQDLMVDTQLGKVKIAPEEEDDMEVKEEPIDIQEFVTVEMVSDGESAGANPEEWGGNEGEMRLLQAENDELRAKVALLEGQASHFEAVLEELFEEYVDSWDPLQKRLHLNRLCFNGSAKETCVLTRFSDVAYLMLDAVKINKTNSKGFVLPEFCQHLKVLKIRYVFGEVDRFIQACLKTCQNLESLTLPRLERRSDVFFVCSSVWEKVSSENSRLKEIDLGSVRDLSCDPAKEKTLSEVYKTFKNLIRECATRGVKIWNPCTRWSLLDFESNERQVLGSCISSIKMEEKSYADYLLLELPKLESLTLLVSRHWVHDLHEMLMTSKLQRRKWFRLCKLEILSESGYLEPIEQETRSPCHFLVEQSPNLEELCLTRCRATATIISGLLSTNSLGQFNCLKRLTLCQSADVSDDCSFLEETWRGLPFLEELTLDGCPISKEKWYSVENSTFLELRSLRKLWLKNMDGILDKNDQFLCNVLSKMQLSHLVIISKKSIASPNLVPRAGIESLMAGCFGRSVCEFLVDRWSLMDLFPGKEIRTG